MISKEHDESGRRMMTEDFKPEHKGICITSNDKNRSIILHPDRSVWKVINEAGYNIVSLCDGHASIREIAHRLSQRYGLSYDSMLSDVKAFVGQLAENDFLLSCDLPYLANTISEKPSPVLQKVNLNVTERCNLQCKHCAVTDGKKQRDYLSTERILRIIDEAKEAKISYLTLGGGEPLIRDDCLKILSYSSTRVKTILNTNATLIDDRTATVLAGLDIHLQISLDGPEERIHDFIRGKGAFTKTLQAIDLLINRGAGGRIAFCVTVSRNNIDHIPDIFALASEKGISSIRFVQLQAMGTAKLHWDTLALAAHDYTYFYRYLYQEVPSRFPEFHVSPGFQGFVLYHAVGKTMWCQIGEILAIDAKGWLYPCPLLMEPEFKLGNIRKMSLQQAIESARMGEIKEICRRRKDDISQCRACAWRHFCQGGCAGSIYQSKGTFYEVDDLCGLRQGMYPQTIFDLAAKRPGSSPMSHKGKEPKGKNRKENDCD